MSTHHAAAPGLALASTIGPIDAGIVPALLEAYRARTGISIALTGAGTNKTLELARGGGFDVVIVHALALEEWFLAEGYGLSRHELMANDFVIVGPAVDPAGVRGLREATHAFRRLLEAEAPFLTRGDLSGTHVKELEVWEAAGLTPTGDWYVTAEHGTEGNLATAREAIALQRYTLLDRATVLTLGNDLGLDPSASASRAGISFDSQAPAEREYRSAERHRSGRAPTSGQAILLEGDPLLLNIISVLPVNPARVTGVRGEAATAFVAWLLGDEAQKLIAKFGVAKYGQPLFFPRAPGWSRTPTALMGRQPQGP